MDGSAMPGTPGVAVIAGHRDTHFRELGELVIGDQFAIELPDGASYTYEVAAIDVVDSNRSMLRLDSQESVVMLVTCYPFESVLAGGSLRYVVMAYPVRR
jgi:sortase A